MACMHAQGVHPGRLVVNKPDLPTARERSMKAAACACPAAPCCPSHASLGTSPHTGDAAACRCVCARSCMKPALRPRCACVQSSEIEIVLRSCVHPPCVLQCFSVRCWAAAAQRCSPWQQVCSSVCPVTVGRRSLRVLLQRWG